MAENKDSVCLIIAPSVFLLDERVFMSLGILKVAAVLEAQGFEVQMVDLSGVENYEDAVRAHAAFSSAKHFGITATTPQMPAAGKIALAIKSVRQDAQIILGGPHVTLMSVARKKELKRGICGRATSAMRTLEENFDILVAGDGEEAIFVALQENAPKLVDADDTESSLFLDNHRLNLLPYPARHLVDVDSYHYFIDGERALSLIAQLGCPYGCSFCGGRFSPSLRRVRMRSTENIINEMRLMRANYGTKRFMLYDDELNVNKEMVRLMRAIRAEQENWKEEWRLRGFIKSQLFTEEQAKAMYDAGFREILVGFESGSPRILMNINKCATVEENTRCIEIAHKQNLRAKALMSIGHPGESAETVMQTYDWLLKVKPDDFDTTIISAYGGTDYYDDAVSDPTRDGIWVYTCPKTGDRLFEIEVDYTKVAEYYKGNPDGGYKSYVFTDYLSADQLVELRDFVERDVREKLGIPFNLSAAAIRFEHSMGQAGPNLPPHILRTSSPSTS